MLTHIQIRDLAIITSLEVEFGPGMTALTGETGAGKSILIDALGLTLGDRADAMMIREGSERAEITSRFDLSDTPQALQWLREQGLDQENDCLLRRLLVRSGSSRAYINGSQVPLKSLQELAERLIDIHGQHAHQLLLKLPYQQQLLDRHAGLEAQLKSCAELHRQWRSCAAQLAELTAQDEERESRIDLLRFQLDELNALQPAEGEFSALEQEYRLASNAGALVQGCDKLDQALYAEDGSLHDLLGQACSSLRELVTLAPELAPALEMLESAGIQLQEAASEIRHFGERVETDPERLHWLNQRIADLHEAARKYRCAPDELAQKRADIETQLNQLRQSDVQLQQLRESEKRLADAYHTLSAELHQARCEDAVRLEQQVNETLCSLGMGGAQLQVRIEPLPEGRTTPQGTDRVSLLISTNPGQPAQPLARIASGGELSRISLAIQVATLECTRVPSLIFDEVDVGIGGAVAEIVGRLLRRIGGSNQVLCVTHLPQVASQAHHHLRIAKSGRDRSVIIDASTLEGDARVQEVARMLGGVEITHQSLAHAREMLQQATAG